MARRRHCSDVVGERQLVEHEAIFSLAILLASSFLYNSEKAINNAAIDQLSLVAQLTQRIRAKSGRGDESAAALASEMPDFLWLLRDFQLELKDESGRPITKDEYLDEALRPQRGTSAAAAELNATRAAIKTLFPRRACETLPHPTIGTRPRRRRTQEPSGAREARTAVPRRRAMRSKLASSRRCGRRRSAASR